MQVITFKIIKASIYWLLIVYQALLWILHLNYLIPSSKQPHEEGTIITPTYHKVIKAEEI